MAAISDKDYNDACAALTAAGSHRARLSHHKHKTRGGSFEYHGRQLLQEARDDFQFLDRGGNNLRAGMTEVRYNAIHYAAKKMGITHW